MAAAQRTDCFEDRQIGLAGAVLLDALTADHSDARQLGAPRITPMKRYPRREAVSARFRRGIGQCRAHLADRRFEHGFADVPMAPDSVQQILFLRQLAGLLRERAQHGEGFRRQSDWTAGPGEQSVLLVQLELIESSGPEATSLMRRIIYAALHV
jgi:hypothetical protein